LCLMLMVVFFPFAVGVEDATLLLLFLLLPIIVFVVFLAFTTYFMRTPFKRSLYFGFFPPGVFFWRRSSREEYLSELRRYEMWLMSELEWVRREIEEEEKRM